MMRAQLAWLPGGSNQILVVLFWITVVPSDAAEDRRFSESIVVTGHREPHSAASFETRHAMENSRIDLLGAASADEIIKRLPAVHIPVNSRGEAIAFIRNAGERQVTIFYEGADINVPWDNRLDLSLVPAALIGSVRTAAGPLAPHYGVNTLAAINLSPRDAFFGLEAIGDGGRREGQFALPLGPLLVGGSYARHDGEPLSDDAALAFSQPGRHLRTNTDREIASLFGRIKGRSGRHDLSLSAFHVEGEKGIAPESNRSSGARFWRYPDVRHTLVTGSISSRLSPATQLDGAAWFQRFGQTIDNHANVAYDRITLRQVDRDRTWGIRELLKHESGPVTLVVSANFLESTHGQRDVRYTAGVPPAVLPSALLYRQRNWSIGGELEYAFSPALRGELGAGIDEVDYLRTGDKPPVRDAKDWTGRAALHFEAGNGWRLRGAIGRKMRAPTMRERFGEAVNRFLPNPDLTPESVVTAELAGEWRGAAGNFYAVPFVQELDGTIDQHNVGALRQRINLRGSSLKGLELGGELRIDPHLMISSHATWSRVRRRNATPGNLNRIAEKPTLLAGLRIAYSLPSGFSTLFEADHTGRAYSADPTGALAPLRRSTSLSLRLGQSLAVIPVAAELFVHIDNLADTLIEPQLGLPEPGRMIRIGLSFG